MLGTLREFLSPDSDAPAILAPGRLPMSHRMLAQQVLRTIAALRRAGVEKHDRVAVVLPNSPEMATCFLGVACAAACAPLNPGYKQAEFEFYLEDLQPRTVIVQQGLDSPVRQAASRLGIRLLELVPEPSKPAGVFGLGEGSGESADFGGAEDVALVLHTSGTTSRPKVVPLAQANLCASARHIVRTLALTEADRCLNVMPLFHIHGLVAALLSSLAAGGSVVCCPGFLAPWFFPWLQEFEPTWYTAVPAIHQSILARARQAGGVPVRGRLRFLRSSSAPLPPSVMEELENAFGAPVIEAYGMTEAAHQMASNPLPPGARKPGSVGLAAGPEIAIRDESGVLHLPGERESPAGEVVIRGPNVTAGYANNRQANDEAFSDGWFRTGDLGRLDAEGYLFLIGRTKEMINRGGEKIAPREVDEALSCHPAVAQALAFAMPDPILGEDVAAAVVLHRGQSATETELREFVARTLADFKIPRRIVFLDEIPKGPTGKLQRIGLAAKLGIAAERCATGPAPYVAPVTETAKALARIWADVLGVERIGLEDDFFACGGDSLLAAVMLARAGEQTGKRLPMTALFTHPALGGFAEYCDSNSAPAGLPAVARCAPAPEYPVSFAQERMWFLANYEPENSPYVSATVWRLTGPLDQTALERSFAALLERHEILRSVYELHGRLVQQVLEKPPVPWRVVDIAGAGLGELRRLAQSERRRPFDLSRDLPLRGVLVRSSGDESFLVLVFHHIATDGWSKSVLADDLLGFYGAFTTGSAPPSELPIQYRDYAVWEREHLTKELFPGQIRYWKQALEGSPPALQLPVDRPRPPHQAFDGASVDSTIAADLLSRFKELCRGRQTTLFMGLLGAFKVLLSRYSGMTDIVVGSPVANRERPETERLIGVFINTLALRTGLSGDPCFREVLDRVRRTALEAFDHRHLPFAAVVDALQPARSPSHTPLYQVLFQVRNFPGRDGSAGSVVMEELDLERTAVSFDLELEATENAGELQLRLIYNRRLFEPATAERMLRQLSNLVGAVCADPDRPVSRLTLLDDSERRKALVEWNDTAADVSPCGPHRLFEQRASRDPDRIAVKYGERELTYSELNRRANRIAHGLAGRGIGRGSFVAVSLERSEMVPAVLLGVLKSGAAYLPLDTRYPAERREFMLRDGGVNLILGDTPGAVSLAGIDSVEEADPAIETGPDDAAYVLYTSGSTGVPKGVVIRHGGFVNLLESASRMLGVTREDRWLAFTTISFDIAGAELFLPLLAGGLVEIAPADAGADGARMAELIASSGCNFLQLTPSGWQILLAGGWPGSRSLRAISTGEELRLDLARRIRPKVARLWNLYGPTETTIWSTAAEIPRNPERITIGWPLANTQCYVLDEHLDPLPPGIPGELYIAGEGLAAGYLNRPELTAERFIANPFDSAGGRMYRTGDRCRFLADGTIDYLGRADHQVKLRGFRIELEEVESAVARHPAVSEAAAGIYSPAAGDQRLVCWYVPSGDGAEAGELKVFLRRWLPDYMIPSHFVPVDSLPLTSSGKLDRKSLAERPILPSAPVPPRPPADAIETRLAGLCGELLRTGPIAVTADLFDLGAHSLLCAELLSRIEREFGRRIPLPALFEHPTVESLASILTGRTSLEEDPRIVAVRRSGTLPPLFWVKADPMFRALASRLPAEQPIFGLFLPEDHRLPRPYRIEDAAACHLDTLRGRGHHGPYLLGGFCAGGLVAYEMARQLEAAGERTSLLILIDAANPVQRRREAAPWIRRQTGQLAGMGPWRYGREKLAAVGRLAQEGLRDYRLARGGRSHRAALAREENPAVAALRYAARRYRPGPLDCPVLLIRRPLDGSRLGDPCLGWSSLVRELGVVELPAAHLGFFFEPQVSQLAEVITARLTRAGTPSPAD